ncbi:MAG TPA: 3-hydroxyacyl-ACP dehydratase FabZ family protein [Beijerinckiaceae bacterium]|nr:3-hydroxyacyl-ACP dehydratase FabZ family protein [Beijerinckiaceae bacterium]
MRLEYFQMIDRVTAFDREPPRLEATSVIPDQSPIFEGHFPGHPLMPGVLLIETMAQTSGYLLLGLNGFARMPFLAGVTEAKLRRFVEPNTPIAMEASLVHEGSGYAVTKARIRADGKAVCDAELMFKILPFPPGLGEQMRAHATGLGMPAVEAVP